MTAVLRSTIWAPHRIDSDRMSYGVCVCVTMVYADMQVLDELRHLESYVEDLHKSGTSIRSLYERVQSSGNVLPRL